MSPTWDLGSSRGGGWSRCDPPHTLLQHGASCCPPGWGCDGAPGVLETGGWVQKPRLRFDPLPAEPMLKTHSGCHVSLPQNPWGAMLFWESLSPTGCGRHFWKYPRLCWLLNWAGVLTSESRDLDGCSVQTDTVHNSGHCSHQKGPSYCSRKQGLSSFGWLQPLPWEPSGRTSFWRRQAVKCEPEALFSRQQ